MFTYIFVIALVAAAAVAAYKYVPPFTRFVDRFKGDTSGAVEAKSAFPLVPILGVLFIALKLTGFIAWSWWWVLAPFWVPLSLVGVFLVSFIIGVLIEMKNGGNPFN